MKDESKNGEALNPYICPRPEHTVSRANISKNAIKVLYRLKDAGYQAHLVGGGVRDILLGLKPKDFDIATDASPEQVKSLFKNCRLIGRRFRLAHILFGRDVIEVATFRASHDSGQGGETEESGRIVRDNVFGDIKEDVMRRDFTVNALYYNIADFSIIDYVGALDDLKNQILRLIGDPEKRLAEDPVRTLRAARFAAKLSFTVAPEVEEQIFEQGHLLDQIPPARLFEEVLKLLHSGHAVSSLVQLRKYDLLQYLFPMADQRLRDGDENFEELINRALANTDRRLEENKSVTPAFLFAVFLWPMVNDRTKVLQKGGMPAFPALKQAADEVIAHQLYHTSIPKRFSIPMREIWAMQSRLESPSGQRALQLIEAPRFRAAYDFLCLRAEAGENHLKSLSKWWTEIQEKSPEEQITMVRKHDFGGQKKHSQRHSRRPKRSTGHNNNGNR